MSIAADGNPAMTPPDGSAVTILVADDDLPNRLVLKSMLARAGYQVLIAENGAEAVEAFTACAPALVLMDLMMPVLDGIEATRRIKAASGDRYCPVIFLTAVTDDRRLAECLDAGGDDFLTKPYNHTVLNAKINAALRLSEIHARSRQQRDALAEIDIQRRRDLQIAERILHSAASASGLDTGNIRSLLRPMDRVNGDIALSALTPDGVQHVMVGDFTGHGLPAAVGAMTVVDTYLAMASKGFSIAMIVPEMNRKLHSILPTGLFLSACLLEIDLEHDVLAVWNGGLPDVLIRGGDGQIMARATSRHAPLGVLGNDALSTEVDRIFIHHDDHVYLYSDGVVEARNTDGELFGGQRLEQVITAAPHGGGFHELRAALDAHCINATQNDDLILLEVVCRLPEHGAEHALVRSRGKDKLPAAWKVAIDLDASALRQNDPLPPLMQLIVDIQGLGEHRERVYIIIKELFANALDHGLLRLDSAMKATPSGFVEFYRLREQRLNELAAWQVHIEVENTPGDPASRMRLVIEHDGTGFDPACRKAPSLDGNEGFCGRGIALIRSLCAALTYNATGTRAEAIYEWPVAAGARTPETTD